MRMLEGDEVFLFRRKPVLSNNTFLGQAGLDMANILNGPMIRSDALHQW